MARRIYIVTRNPDGTPNETEMRPWLRQNPDQNPSGMDHQAKAFRLKDAFREKGWLTQKLQKKFLIIQPDENGSTAYANDLLEEGLPNADDDDEIVEAAIDTSLSLEADLEDALVANLEQLEEGLQLYHDQGRFGRQFDAKAAGRIDLLAVDSQQNIVVVELKAGEADRQVCGQIQAYMGWVKANLAGDRAVRGIIVAHEFTERAKLAATVAPGLSLKKYRVNFTFDDA